MLVVSGDGVPLAVPVLRSLTPLSAASFSRLTDYQPSANYCSSHADFAMTSFQLQVPSAAMGGVVTIGNFDGVHRGHQAMLSVVREHAVKKDCPAVVVTFDPHPITILKPDVHLPRLSTIPVRSQLLKQHGADEVIVLPVCKQLLNMTPEQFFQDVVAQLQPVGMVEGPDFRFGRDRAGDTTVLQTFCDSADIDLKVGVEYLFDSTFADGRDAGHFGDLSDSNLSLVVCGKRWCGRSNTGHVHVRFLSG